MNRDEMDIEGCSKWSTEADEKTFSTADPLKQEPMEDEVTFDDAPSDDTKNENFKSCLPCGICQIQFANIDEITKHISVCSQGEMSKPEELNNGSLKPKIHHSEVPETLLTGSFIKVEESLENLTNFVSSSNELPTKKETPDEDSPKGMSRRLPKKNICDICKVGFRTHVLLQQHMPKHASIETTQKPYKCYFCEEHFESEELSEEHSRIHSGVRPYPCECCDEAFTFKKLLKLHKATHLEAVQAFLKYMCQECGEIFTSKYQLQNHRKLVEQLHQCHLCTESFKRNRHLHDHLLKHPEYNPHPCHLCEAVFKRVGELKRHLREHKLKAFECDFCNRRFMHPSSLKDHISAHAPFECHSCKAAFSYIDDLQRHIATQGHDYKCNVCDTSFLHKQDLRSHMYDHM